MKSADPIQKRPWARPRIEKLDVGRTRTGGGHTLETVDPGLQYCYNTAYSKHAVVGSIGNCHAAS